MNSEYENYFCYGCHRGGNIINLLSEIDNISIRHSVKKLIEGIDINETDVLNSLIKALESGEIVDNDKSIEVLSLKINRLCYEFLKEVNFDNDELYFFDQVFQKVDKIIRTRDIDTLQEIYDFIIDGILYRKKKYLEKEEKKLIEK